MGGRGDPAVITVLVPAGTSAGRRAAVEETEQHHLRVRRAREGELVGLRDGAGLVGTGRLVPGDGGWEVEVEAVERRARPAELTIAIGAGDRERFAWLIEKCAELGVTTVQPLETERSGGVASRLRESHISKLRRHARETVKQCGAAWAPEIAEPVGFESFLARPRAGHGWIADIAGEPPPAVLDRSPVTVVVGPEGGLSGNERAALLAAGYHPTSLGPHTLRFETAALAAAAAVSSARLRGSHG